MQYLSSEAPRASNSYTVTAEPTLNIRDTPNGSKVGKLRHGDQVDVFTIEKDAAGIRWAEITSGWVMADFLQATDDE